MDGMVLCKNVTTCNMAHSTVVIEKALATALGCLGNQRQQR